VFTNIRRWTLVRRKGAKIYQVRYFLNDGSVRERTTKETVRRQAERRAIEILREADESGSFEIYGWAEFCVRYESEQLAARPFKTREAFRTARSRLDQLCPEIRFVSDISAKLLVAFAVRLRQEGKSEATIQAYRNHLMSALKWAEEVEVIKCRPKPPRLLRVPSGSRGRAVTREEFERMMDQIPAVVGKEFESRWRWNLEALWLGGFRLGETFSIYWEQSYEGHHLVDLDSPKPKISINQNAEKAFRNRLLPMPRDLADHFRSVPANRRNGLVFKWPMSRGYSTSKRTVGCRISELGKLANVKVGQKKYASCHDIRRSFGSRWSMLVQPFVLRTLMRHSSISTTERYYVTIESDRIADQIAKAEDTGLEPAAP